jgi:cytoskeletal protein CcmA (bactofilin family)
MSVFNNQVESGAPPAPQRRTPPPPSQPGASSQPASSSGPQTPANAASPNPAGKVSVLGKTLVFKGELSADEDIILQGRVEGAIHHTQSVTVGIDGVVIGDTHARSIVVEGTVEGDLHGVVSVLIAASATVRGNISAPRVGIMEGANFNGSVDMHSSVGAVRGSDANPRTEYASSSDIGLTDRSVEKIITK